MAVQAVYLEADAFLVCLNHALSTEKEEVMGLCIGEVLAVRWERPRRGRRAGHSRTVLRGFGLSSPAAMKINT